MPDRGLGIGMAFGVAVDAEEIHPHLGELAEDGLVIVNTPGVEAERMGTPGIYAPQTEQWRAGFVYVGDRG